MNFKKSLRAALPVVALVLITLAFFAPAGGNDFVMFDDDINIYNNPILGELSWGRVHWAFTDHFYMPRYMPLGWVSLVAIFQFGGLEPAAYHWTNIVLHIANAVLVLGVVGQGLRLVAKARGLDVGRRWISVLAFGATLVWAVHPLRVEPVSWATSIHYLQATFWALIAVSLAWARLDKTGNARRWRLWSAWGAYVLSVLVYPVTLGLPGALFLFEWWLSSRGSRQATGHAVVAPTTSWKSLIPEQAPFMGIGGLALLANIAMRLRVAGIFPAAPDLQAFSFQQRVLQAAEAAVYQIVRPWVAGDPTPVYNSMYADGRPTAVQIGCVAGILLALAALAWRGRRWPGWAAWFGGCAAVGVSYYGLLESPFQSSDRYTYFPSLMLVMGATALALGVRSGKARLLVTLVACGWWGWMASTIPAAMATWHDSGHLYARIAAGLERKDMAALYTERAIIQQARAGHFPEARAQLAAMEEAGAAPYLLARIGQSLDRLEAEARVSQRMPATRGWVAPDAQVAHNYALVARRAGEVWTARMRFEYALKLDPGFNDARYNFALWLAARGEADAAWKHYGILSQATETMDPRLELPLLTLIERGAEAGGARTIQVQCVGRIKELRALN